MHPPGAQAPAFTGDPLAWHRGHDICHTSHCTAAAETLHEQELPPWHATPAVARDAGCVPHARAPPRRYARAFGRRVTERQ